MPINEFEEPDVLLSKEMIQDRVAELARQISRSYEGVGTVHLLGVLRGSFIFLADLARELSVPRNVDFIALSSYESGTTATGAVRLMLDTRTPLRGEHVLVVEDIVDTGYTLEYLLKTLRAREPASIKTCVLLQKPDRMQVPTSIDYLGFTIPDKWVVGYGLDYEDKFRALPYIGTVDPSP